jgi:hypothetical protein
VAGPARALWALGDGLQAVRALATDRTWARIEAALRTQADGAGELDWDAQIDSSVIRAHQHAAGAGKVDRADPGKPPASAGAVTGRADHQVHTVGEGRGRNLATRLTPGQGADTCELVVLVDAVRVARLGGRGPGCDRII